MVTRQQRCRRGLTCNRRSGRLSHPTSRQLASLIQDSEDKAKGSGWTMKISISGLTLAWLAKSIVVRSTGRHILLVHVGANVQSDVWVYLESICPTRTHARTHEAATRFIQKASPKDNATVSFVPKFPTRAADRVTTSQPCSFSSSNEESTAGRPTRSAAGCTSAAPC